MKSLLAAAAIAFAASTSVFAADAYKLDPSHSQILFSYDHLGFSTTYGLISGFDGNVTLDADAIENSSVELEITLADLFKTGWADRDAHFLSADFLNAEANPVATFKSTAVEKTGDDTAKITGDLTIAGTTKSVVLDTKLNKIGDHPFNKKGWAGFDATTTINRADFGINKFQGVGDVIDVRISVEAEKLAAS